MKDSKRKCMKCGSSSADSGVVLYRFPSPGIRNVLRCELWAKFMFPDGPWSSQEFQKKLYSEHRMLCQNHFKHTSFIEFLKKLHKNAAPDEEFKELSNSNTSKEIFIDITNTTPSLVTQIDVASAAPSDFAVAVAAAGSTSAAATSGSEVAAGSTTDVTPLHVAAADEDVSGLTEYCSSEEEVVSRSSNNEMSGAAAASTAVSTSSTVAPVRKRKLKAPESEPTGSKKVSADQTAGEVKRPKSTLSELFFSDDEDHDVNEDEVRVGASGEPQELLQSSLTKRAGDGNLRWTQSLDGSLYCELRVYEVCDIKSTPSRDRWRKALKYQFDYDSPECAHIIELIRKANKNFSGKPMYYPDKN